MRTRAIRGGLAVTVLAISAAPLFSQTIQDVNANAWLMYFGDHALSRHWGAHLEGQVRRADMGLTWQQLLLRRGVNYQFNKYVLGTLGYAFVRSYPYGDYPSRAPFIENRFYEQVLIKHTTGPLRWQHRLRNEQRQVDTGINGRRNWELRQRFRYMLRADVPLPQTTRFYLGLYNEFFVNYGGNRGQRYLDQNRTYGALGTKVGRYEKFEAGYLHQYVQQRNGRIVEHNHTLQIALFSSRPFRSTSK